VWLFFDRLLAKTEPGTRHTPTTIAWPPKGIHLALKFVAPSTAPASLGKVAVIVHYELYDGLPAFRKWVEVENGDSADC